MDLIRSLELGESGQLVEVRRFPDPAIRDSIAAALASVSERSAILALEANATGYNAAVAAKLDGHWSIAVAYTRADWGWAAASTVKFSW